MYAIARNDLDMNPGKLASQIGHAFVGAHTNAPQELQEQYGNGTKICLYASLEQILEIERYCIENKIPHYLMVDEHHVMLPHFTGKPIVTAIGIGPITKQSASFLKQLQLIR